LEWWGMQFFKNLNKERGAVGGIPEQVIAMAVDVVVVAGMIVLGSQLFDNVKIKRNAADLSMLATNIQMFMKAVLQLINIKA